MDDRTLYKITVKGIAVECFSLEAAKLLIAEYADAGERESTSDASEQVITPNPSFGGQIPQKSARTFGETSITILKTIAAAKLTGVHTPDIQRALGVADGRAVGGPAVRLQADLKALGFHPKKVYTTKRDGSGRLWRMGTEIHRAIKALGGDSEQMPLAAEQTTPTGGDA